MDNNKHKSRMAKIRSRAIFGRPGNGRKTYHVSGKERSKADRGFDPTDGWDLSDFADIHTA